MTPKEALSSLPRRVKIGPHQYKIKIVKLVSGEKPEEGWAQIDTDACLLEICKDQKSSIAIAGSVLHKLLHGIWHENELGKTATEESAVRTFERGFVALAQDNPELILWMVRCITA